MNSESGGGIRDERDTGFGWGKSLRAEGGAEIGVSTDALFAFFRSQLGTTPPGPVPVTIGGVPGDSIDLEIDKEVLFTFGPAGVRVWEFAPGFKVRVIAVDVERTLVVFMIEVTPADAFDSEMAGVQPILDSIAWQ